MYTYTVLFAKRLVTSIVLKDLPYDKNDKLFTLARAITVSWHQDKSTLKTLQNILKIL
jgi:hypothetical protein